MANVQLFPPSGASAYIQGRYGTYQAAADGTFTVDSRDAATLIAQLGFNYLRNGSNQYRTPAAPLIATAGQIVASAVLSNGALTIANQPDVLRQVAVRVDPGTVAITAGAASVTYVGNDGASGTDSVSLATAASTLLTTFLSRGVAKITAASISALAGGATPHIQFDTTVSISVPVDPSSVDVTFTNEIVDATNEAVGTKSAATIGTIAPTTAPNSTHNFTFGYTFVSPNV